MVSRVRVGLEWEEEEMEILSFLRPQWAGVWSLIFSMLRSFGPSIYCLPAKNIRSIRHTQKLIESWQPPKNILILYLDLK